MSPGTNPSSLNVPKFMNRAIEALQIQEHESEKPRPDGLSEDLILDSSLANLVITQVMKCMWTVSVKADAKEFLQHIVKLR